MSEELLKGNNTGELLLDCVLVVGGDPLLHTSGATGNNSVIVSRDLVFFFFFICLSLRKLPEQAGLLGFRFLV